MLFAASRNRVYALFIISLSISTSSKPVTRIFLLKFRLSGPLFPHLSHSFPFPNSDNRASTGTANAPPTRRQRHSPVVKCIFVPAIHGKKNANLIYIEYRNKSDNQVANGTLMSE